MAIEIKHAFTSAKGDGGDATLVRPSNWNAAHTTSIATNKLVGRTSPGTGSFEEIALSALVAAALDETTGAAFLSALGVGGFDTGDVKWTLNSSATAGWIIVNSAVFTLSKSGSGGSYAAADAEPLYTALWNSTTNTEAPVSSGRGANAAADFAAGKTITLPPLPGRAPIGAGSGSGITTRVNGGSGGAETHALSTAELASHYHSAAMYDPTHVHGVSHNAAAANSSTTGGGAFSIGGSTASIGISGAATGVRVNSANGLDTTYSAGSGTAHNNMPPWVALTVKVKL